MRQWRDYAIMSKVQGIEMSKTRNPFDVLGVTPEDDMATIRMAWRGKVRLLHPDRATDKAEATARLAEVNAAFDALQGHAPRRRAKRPGFTKTDAMGRRARAQKTNVDVPSEATPKQGAPRRQKPQTDGARRQPAVNLSAEMLALSRRARAGYARARDILAAA